MIDRAHWKESVYEGWHDLLDKMFDRLEYEISRQNLQDFQIMQVKEKFGLLRVYMSPWNEKCREIIEQAIRESSHICEYCGRHAHLQSIGSWLKTVCDSCRDKVESQR